MMPNSLRYGLPLTCILLMVLFGTEAIWGWLPQRALQERRRAAEWPQWGAGHPDVFTRKVGEYVDDRFPARSTWIRTFQFLSYRVFGRSARPDKAVVGKAGWLYKGGLQLDLYRAKYRFNPRQLEQLATELERRRRRVEALGGRYYLAIPPLKARVYPEFLPTSIRPLNPQSATEQLVEYLHAHTEVAYIDLLTPLQTYRKQQAAQEPLLYMKTDHHWTPLGGLIATRTLVEQWKRDFPALPAIAFDDYYFKVDTTQGLTLAEMLGLEATLSEPFVTLHPTFEWQAQAIARSDYPPPPGFPFPDQYAMERRRTNSDLPTLYVNRESFGGELILPLSEHFRRSFFFFDNWAHDLNEEVYRKEGGDIYLQLVWEGMLYTLLTETVEDYAW